MSREDVVEQSSTTIPTDAGGLTRFATFKRDCGMYYGMDQDPEKEEFIGRIAGDIIDDLNTKKLWQFNLVQAADFNSVAGTADYALSTIAPNLWKIYSLRKSNDIDYILTGVRQRTFDIMFQSQNSIRGYPYVRTEFNIFRDGNLHLFPTPDAVHTFQLRYFRLIAKPSGDGATFDMPGPFQTLVKYGTLARLGAMNEQPTSMQYWESKFQEAYRDANRMDEMQADEDLRFINIEEMGNINYVNPALRPRYLDFY